MKKPLASCGLLALAHMLVVVHLAALVLLFVIMNLILFRHQIFGKKVKQNT